METLITIGVIIYIIFSIRKALSFGKKPGEKPAPGGWQEKLQEMARQIKEEMEKANQQASGHVPTPPPLPKAPNGLDWGNLEENETQSLEEIIDEDARDYEVQVVAQVPPLKREIPAPVIKKSEPVIAVPGMVREKTGYSQSRKNDLRRAIIWSEILAKPLSLRD